MYCSDASISRYLRSQNWDVKKASQMLKQNLKWREEYKPEEIRWVSYYLSFTFSFCLSIQEMKHGWDVSWLLYNKRFMFYFLKSVYCDTELFSAISYQYSTWTSSNWLCWHIVRKIDQLNLVNYCVTWNVCSGHALEEGQVPHVVIFYSDKSCLTCISFLMKEEVSDEAETGKMYRPNYCDKHGRSVLIMRPSRQVSSENHF